MQIFCRESVEPDLVLLQLDGPSCKAYGDGHLKGVMRGASVNTETSLACPSSHLLPCSSVPK